MKRSHLIAGVAVAASVALQAEGQRPPQQKPAQTFRTGTEVVFVDVAVRDGARVVTGLQATDFELKDNGVRQRIESVEATAVPIDLTIVIDLSANVRRPWSERRQAARVTADVQEQFARMTAMLRPEDRVRLIGLDENVQPVIPPSPVASIPAMRPLEFDGKPALYDALTAALLYQVSPSRRHVVIAATKGRDGLSSVDAQAVRAIAERTDALFHVVLMEAAADADDETARFRCGEMGYCWPTRNFWMPYRRVLFGPREAHDLTPDGIALGQGIESTGGRLHRTMALAEPSLFGTFKKTLEDFRGGYMLRYTPQGVSPTGWHDIDVRVPAHRAYSVRARNGYGVEEQPLTVKPGSSPAGSLRTLRDYLSAYERGAYLEVASAMRQAADTNRLMREFEAADNPWPAAPRREAVFALDLSEPGVFSRDPDTHARAVSLLERFTRLVRHPMEPDVFELYWHFAALTMVEGALRPRELDGFVTRALERFPAEPRFLLSRAIGADQLANSTSARAGGAGVAEAQRVAALYEAAAAFPQTAPEARIRFGWLLYGVGRHEQALGQLDAIGATPLPEQALEYLRRLIRGHVLLALRRQEDGIQSFRAALEVRPAAQSARVALMNALVMRGDRAEAQALAEQVQAETADDVDPWWMYWQGQYRLQPAVLARLRELMVQ